MMKRERLCAAIKWIAWGYVLLHLNINLGTLNILPDWLGYVFFINALPILGEEEPSAPLLKPLGQLLAIWTGFVWIFELLRLNVNFHIIEIIVSAISLYFHFQLLTNLASIAEKYACPEQKRILTLRTVRTVLITVMALPVNWSKMSILVYVIIVIQLVVAFWICRVLFKFRKSLLSADRQDKD